MIREGKKNVIEGYEKWSPQKKMQKALEISQTGGVRDSFVLLQSAAEQCKELKIKTPEIYQQLEEATAKILKEIEADIQRDSQKPGYSRDLLGKERALAEKFERLQKELGSHKNESGKEKGHTLSSLKKLIRETRIAMEETTGPRATGWERKYLQDMLQEKGPEGVARRLVAAKEYFKKGYFKMGAQVIEDNIDAYQGERKEQIDALQRYKKLVNGCARKLPQDPGREGYEDRKVLDNLSDECEHRIKRLKELEKADSFIRKGELGNALNELKWTIQELDRRKTPEKDRGMYQGLVETLQKLYEKTQDEGIKLEVGTFLQRYKKFK